MTTCPYRPDAATSRGGVARPIAPASGTLLAVLILLTVLPSAAAVSCAGVDAASWSTMVEATPASRGSAAPRADSASGDRVAGAASPHRQMPVIGVMAIEDAGERLSWADAMASRGLGAMPPPMI